jgi:hypothetical protein
MQTHRKFNRSAKIADLAVLRQSTRIGRWLFLVHRQDIGSYARGGRRRMLKTSHFRSSQAKYILALTIEFI